MSWSATVRIHGVVVALRPTPRLITPGGRFELDGKELVEVVGAELLVGRDQPDVDQTLPQLDSLGTDPVETPALARSEAPDVQHHHRLRRYAFARRRREL